MTAPAEVKRPAAGSWQVDVGRSGPSGSETVAVRVLPGERGPDDERRTPERTPGHPQDLVVHGRERWRVKGVPRVPEDGHDIARGACHMRHCHISGRKPGPRPGRQRRYRRLPGAPVRSGAQAWLARAGRGGTGPGGSRGDGSGDPRSRLLAGPGAGGEERRGRDHRHEKNTLPHARTLRPPPRPRQTRRLRLWHGCRGHGCAGDRRSRRPHSLAHEAQQRRTARVRPAKR